MNPTLTPWLPRLRTIARVAGWLAALGFAATAAVLFATGGDGARASLVAIVACIPAGVYATIEMGLTPLVFGRAEVSGLSSLVQEVVTGRPTVLEGRFVRAVGAVWLAIGLFVTVAFTALSAAAAFDLATGPWPPDLDHVLDPCHPTPVPGEPCSNGYCPGATPDGATLLCSGGVWTRPRP